MTTTYLPHILGTDSVSVLTSSGMRAVPKTHPNYEAIREALRVKEFDKVLPLLDIPKALEEASDGEVRVVNGLVKFRGRVIDDAFTSRLLRTQAEGFDVQPMLNFLTRLQRNPSMTARRELALFIQHADIPITEDGYFLAWKRVKEDYTSIYDSSTDHSVGKTVEVPRQAVDDDRNNTCSYGLHFAAYGYLDSYASSYGNRTITLKVDPADVVAIPKDYNNMKGRAWRYIVVGEIDKTVTATDMNSAVTDKGASFTHPELDTETDPEDEADLFDDPNLVFVKEESGIRFYDFDGQEVRIWCDHLGHRMVSIVNDAHETITIDTAHSDLNNAENVALNRCQTLFM
jgi:hypothetical protein